MVNRALVDSSYHHLFTNNYRKINRQYVEGVRSVATLNQIKIYVFSFICDNALQQYVPVHVPAINWVCNRGLDSHFFFGYFVLCIYFFLHYSDSHSWGILFEKILACIAQAAISARPIWFSLLYYIHVWYLLIVVVNTYYYFLFNFFSILRAYACVLCAHTQYT